MELVETRRWQIMKNVEDVKVDHIHKDDGWVVNVTSKSR